MKITNDALESILSSYSGNSFEQGGILGGRGGRIVVYYHDTDAAICTSSAVYIPNTVALNAIIQEWAEKGISFLGIVHSHPDNENSLSDTDMLYVSKVFEQYKIGSTLYFPIIVYGTMLPYSITKTDTGLSVISEKIEVYI